MRYTEFYKTSKQKRLLERVAAHGIGAGVFFYW
jgi:hypothetical protein